MNEMPKDFGPRYILWAIFNAVMIFGRWVWLNPLTLLFLAQGELVDLAMENPAWKWASRGASFCGIVIAQIRNRNKDYRSSFPQAPEGKPGPSRSNLSSSYSRKVPR